MSIPCSISLVRSPPQSPVIHLESALNASAAIALADKTRAAAADSWQISRVLLCCFFIPTSSSLLLLNCFYLTRFTFSFKNNNLYFHRPLNWATLSARSWAGKDAAVPRRSPVLASNSSTLDGSNCRVRVSPTCGATSGARRQQTLVSLSCTNTRVSGPVGSVTWTSARILDEPLPSPAASTICSGRRP